MVTPYSRQIAPWSLMLLGASFVVATLFFFDSVLRISACPLCLIQRPSWFLLLILIPITLLSPSVIFSRILCTIMALAMVATVGYAIYQVGGEWSWWNNECSNAWQNIVEFFVPFDPARLPEFVPCDDEPWRLFGLSLAGYNVLGAFYELFLLGVIVLRAERSKE